MDRVYLIALRCHYNHRLKQYTITRQHDTFFRDLYDLISLCEENSEFNNLFGYDNGELKKDVLTTIKSDLGKFNDDIKGIAEMEAENRFTYDEYNYYIDEEILKKNIQFLVGIPVNCSLEQIHRIINAREGRNK